MRVLPRYAVLLVAALLAALVPAAIPHLAPPATAATNIINDPGFEAQTSSAPGNGWSCIGNCGIDVQKGFAHSGTNNGFVRFNSGWNAIHQVVNVNPHTIYRLSGWLRTSSNNIEGYIGARYTNGGPVRNEDRFAAVADWTKFTVDVNSMTASQLEVYTGIWASQDVYVQVDDFEMVAVGPDQIGPAGRMYPRVIRLQHSGSANGQLIATATSFDGGNHVGVYRSTDDGESFTHIGDVTDPTAASGLCCSSVYELPVAIGSLPAGTLLDAASYGQNPANKRMTLDLWSSADHGVSWSKVSTVRSAPNSGGLWEPELRVNKEGQLTMYWSDETIAGHSQAIEEAFSADGVSWSQNYPVVSLADSGARPGMPNVRELPNGTRIMSYEICGSSYNCEIYYRTSSDGADWGDPGTAGVHVVATDGTRFQHAPSITVVDDGSANGKIVMAGQVYLNSAGRVDGGNGITLLTNTNNGSGAWTRIVSPVSVPNAVGTDPCPNYSSGLVATADNLHVLQVGTELIGNDCYARTAAGRI